MNLWKKLDAGAPVVGARGVKRYASRYGFLLPPRRLDQRPLAGHARRFVCHVFTPDPPRHAPT